MQLGESGPPCLPGPPCCRLRKTDDFARTVSKTDVLGLLAAKTASGRASWRPRQPPDGPPGAQDGLQTGFLARKTASDGPPGAPDGFRTGLLTPQTASDGPSPADKFTCRQDHLPTSPPASQVSPGAKRAFDACTFLPLTPYCRDSLLDKTAARRT